MKPEWVRGHRGHVPPLCKTRQVSFNSLDIIVQACLPLNPRLQLSTGSLVFFYYTFTLLFK